MIVIWMLIIAIVNVCDGRVAQETEISMDGSTTSTATSSVIVPSYEVPPFIDTAKYMPDVTSTKDIYGCCVTNEMDENEKGTLLEPAIIGKMPQFTITDTEKIIHRAREAWDGGSGIWPQMSLLDRIRAIENVLDALMKKRTEIVHILMWEIGKNIKDAQSEFDRTIEFARQVINVIKTDSEYNTSWESIGSVKAFVRRAAIGIIMCLGPYNYPLNETYATLIPALLMGNIIVLKIPTIGGLVHFLTIETFQKYLPKGTIHFVSGSGRSTMPPLMSSGVIDGLAFIGGSNAADKLAKQHPNPHRLKLFLQLEAKNLAVYLENLFDKENKAEFDNAIEQTAMGTLSYNGQRCTALKLLMVPKLYGDTFVENIVKKIESLTVGLPWESSSLSKITPLPTKQRVEYMKELIADAVDKGAKIMNKNGGNIIGGDNSTLMIPAVLYPVTKDMKLYEEEQFGPVIPITLYDNVENDIIQLAKNGIYGQQMSIFTGTEKYDENVSKLIDRFSTIVGKININTQCGRSPDTIPFSGRRSSALGVMSVRDALKEFSIPTVVSYKNYGDQIISHAQKTSKFLASLDDDDNDKAK